MTRAHHFVVPLAVLLAAVGRAQNGAPEFPYSMDFGPCMTTTLVSRDVPGETHKALVVRLDGGAAAFDTETLRLSAIWSDGWLDLRGTAYDGAHGPMPGIQGHVIAATKPGPGCADGAELADPRPRPFGPLPKEWGAYDGYWLCADGVVLGYRIGDMAVKEAYGLERRDGVTVGVRHLEFGPSAKAQTLVVFDAPTGGQQPGLMELTAPGLTSVRDLASMAAVTWQPAAPGAVQGDVSFAGWERLAMGGPSAGDHLDRSSGTGATVRFVPGFLRPQGAPALAEGAADSDATTALPSLNDGGAGGARVAFEGRGQGRLHVDLQRAVDVSRVSTFSDGDGANGQQRYDLYGAAGDAPPALDAKDPAAAGWTMLGEVRTERGRDGRHGASVARPDGLGSLRHLLFVVHRTETPFAEIDVFADRFRAAVDATGRGLETALAAVMGPAGSAELSVQGSRVLLRVPAHQGTTRVKVLLATGDDAAAKAFYAQLADTAGPVDLSARVAAAPTSRWGAPIEVAGNRGADDGPFAVDTITVPFDNRYGSLMRVCGFDFFRDGRAAITTWNGDVWVVDGIDDGLAKLRWQRFATGMYDPLGLRIVDDVVYVHGRDGITRLHDRDGDGEADRYECFNHDVEVTNAFHEFAFDLQTDAEGNFYCSKGAPVNPGGRGFMRIAAHHGTILKIAKDGSALEVVATGMRAPNGIGVSPDGIVTSGDNEGTWMPRCRLNWITDKGYYAGVRDTAHRDDVPDQPDLPLCWMPMDVDNSSGGQVWVTGDRWGPLQGRLLHLSYGTCGVYLVLKEEVDGQVQGGVVRLPCSFSSSAMRARFHPVDGQLYVAGLQGWQTSAARIGGFHRVRHTGQPLHLPVALRTCKEGVYLTFAEPLAPDTAADPDSYGVEIWNYLYSQNYGSPELSILHPERQIEQGKPNRDPLPVTAAKLSPDGRTVFLAVQGMQPVMQMRIAWNVDAADGAQLKGELHNTIHRLGDDPGFPPAPPAGR
ncbi:MAG: DUF6797 domain-containing protein [Planctomycetota bacterium]